MGLSRAWPAFAGASLLLETVDLQQEHLGREKRSWSAPWAPSRRPGALPLRYARARSKTRPDHDIAMGSTGHTSRDVAGPPHQRERSAEGRSEPLRATSPPAARGSDASGAAVNILGISGFYHDSAAALVRDGEIVAAAQEERFTRNKHDAALPRQRRRATACDDGRVGRRRPRRRRLLRQAAPQVRPPPRTYLRGGPDGLRSFRRAMPIWLRREALDPLRRSSAGCSARLSNAGAPLLHRAPREPRRQRLLPLAVRVRGGAHLRRRGRVGHHQHRRRRGQPARASLRQLNFPHSLGLLYSAFTYFCGFRVNSGEYKLMGLAPYGEPRYVDLILRRADRPARRRLLPR